MKFKKILVLYLFATISFTAIILWNNNTFALSNSTITIPTNITTLKTQFLTTFTDEVLLQNSTNQIGFLDTELIKSLLERTDINAKIIRKHIETNNENSSELFHELLQLEQERFTQNLLNEDYGHISFFKQFYYAFCASFFTNGLPIISSVFLAGSFLHIAKIIRLIYHHASAVNFLHPIWFTATSLYCYAMLSQTIIPEWVSAYFRHHFDLWNMFSILSSILKNDLLAATFIWTSYKLLTKIISQRELVAALQKEIALAPTHSLFEATLYAFLGRLYDSGHLNNLEQSPEIVNQIYIPGV